MKPYGYLAMASFLFFGAYRCVIQTNAIRHDFPEHFIGKLPVWLTKAIGAAFAASGFYFVYLAAT